MLRSLSALSFSLLLTSVAAAGPMSVDRQARTHASSQRYVVSANLNKLVFWHVPDRGEVKPQR